MRRILFGLVLGFGLTAGAAAWAQGQILCSRPLAPTCMDFDGTFQDASATERCREELARYRRDMETYLTCLQDEAASALKRVDEALAAFECRAQGRTDCG